jgi:hypothetical protein
MSEYRNQTFHNRTLILDGQRYLGCRFINADLRYKGTAPFAMQGSRFEGYFNLEWDRHGADAIAMVQMLDREVRGCGFDLELASHLARWPDRVWRFHTHLPRS